MKKLIVLLLIVFSMSSLFAELDPGNGYSNTLDSPATTLVTLDLSGKPGSQDTVIELFFTGDKPSKDTAPSTPKTGVTIAFPSGAQTAIANNDTDPVYVWWKIVSPENLKIQLGMDSPLMNQTQGSTDSIKWTASWSDVVEGEVAGLSENGNSITSPELKGESVTYGPTPLGTHPVNGKLGSSGFKQINIATEKTDFSKISAGKYQAMLYLQVTTDK